MRYEDFPELEFPREGSVSVPTRRDFLKIVGNGIVILFAVPGALAQERPGSPARPSLPADFNAFLRIDEDGRVTGFTGKIEMGQGIHTSLSQMLADELNVALDSVSMVMGDTDLCPWDMGTWGSMTTRFFGPPFRKAAAKARMVLLEMASEELGVSKERLKTREGVVYEVGGSRRISYGRLTRGKTIARQVEMEPVLQSPADFDIVGKDAVRLDGVDKVTGEARFAADLKEPGMLHAKLLRPPAHGARLLSADTTEARKIRGVQVVEQENLIAVLHRYPDRAEEAVARVKARWAEPKPDLDQDSIFGHLLSKAPEATTAGQAGDLAAGEESAAHISEETYLNSYVAHAPMEPPAALAKFEGDRAIIRASTQNPFGLRRQAARLLGVAEDKVRVVTPPVGGGFGGKTSNQQAIEALRLTKATGKPVQVAWSRGEEFFYDSFRPAAVVKLKAGVTRSGQICSWDYRVYFAGQRGAEHFYDIPHHRTLVHGRSWRGAPGTHPFGTGAWRAPAANTNTFARESHIDILASQIGIDPVEFRLRNLKDKRMRRVLETAAGKFGWTGSKAPSGRGCGVSCGMDAGTYVAHCAEVEVDNSSGEVQVRRVTCAQDMGLCINPQGATMQIEGCITMGLGYALKEEIKFKGGKILDTNFDSYQIPRFSWVPEIESVIVDNPETPPQGGGEPAIICMGAVLANAVFDATGARALQLPMTPQRIKRALT